MTTPTPGRPTPRTPEQRAALRKNVEQRVANATPAQKARVEAMRKALQDKLAKT